MSDDDTATVLRGALVTRLETNPTSAWALINAYAQERLGIAGVPVWWKDIGATGLPWVVVIVIEEALPRLYQMDKEPALELVNGLSNGSAAFWGINEDLL